MSEHKIRKYIERKRSLKASITLQALAQFLSIGFGVIATSIIARNIGADSYGKISYAYALIAILAPVGSMGMRETVSALLRDRQALSALVETASWIEITSSVAIALVAGIITHITESPLTASLVTIAALANVASATKTYEAKLFNEQEGSFIAITNSIQAALGLTLTVAAIYTSSSLIVICALPLLRNTIKSVLIIYRSQKFNNPRLTKKFDTSTAIILIRRGIPLMLSGLSIIVYTRIDQIVIEYLQGFKSLGIYSAATLTSSSLYFIPMIIAQTYTPRFNRESNNIKSITNHANRQEMKNLFRIGWILGIIMLGVTCTILPAMSYVVFGNEFRESANLVIWLAPTSFTVSIGCVFATWQNINDRMDLMLKSPLAGAAINVTLNFLFIPILGLKGAAISTNIASLSSVYLIASFDEQMRSDLWYLTFPFGNHRQVT